MTTMTILQSAARAGLNERAFAVLDTIEYRRVTTQEDLEAIQELRRKSYLKAGIFNNPQPEFSDPSDLDPSIFVFGIYSSEVLVATLRIHILTPTHRHGNSLRFFPNVLQPLLDQGMSFMDPTRFAIDPDADDVLSVLPFVTLRLGFVAAKHFDTDFCLSMIKDGHGGFYRRVFRSTQLTPFTSFDVFRSPYALFSSPKAMEEAICTDYPLFRSLGAERRQLFDQPRPGQPKVLSVRPTARAALRATANVRQTG